MTKKIILSIVAGIAAFVIGLGGAFFVLPQVAPEFVDAALDLEPEAVEEDATEEADTRVEAVRLDVPADAEAPPAEEQPSQESFTDDPNASPEEACPPLPIGEMVVKQDTLQLLNERWQAASSEADELRKQLAALETEIANAQRHRADMAELSGTLTRLQERELAPILEQMDINAVRVLYEEASSRNRTRILQAMPADRAAGFIDELVTGAAAIE